MTYDDPRDASDAVRDRDRYRFDGAELRVEIVRGRNSRVQPHRDSGGDGGGHRGGGGPRPAGEFRVVVTGLPESASWQDLKVSTP